MGIKNKAKKNEDFPPTSLAAIAAAGPISEAADFHDQMKANAVVG